MSEIVHNIPFPLDEEGFFRRQCPYCNREFKVLLEKDELNQLSNNQIDSYLVESNNENNDNEHEEETEYTCPYCGQCAPKEKWWTQEQVDYIHVFLKNIVASLLNNQLIKPLKRTYNKSNSFLRFEGKEIEQVEPWISPEINDMVVFELPCCNRKLKIDDSWLDITYCFFCGFPHRNVR